MSSNGNRRNIQKLPNHAVTIEDGIRVNPNVLPDAVPDLLGPSITCVRDLIRESAENSPEKPFLGWRPTPNSPYAWRTYSEFYTRLKKFGSGLHTFDILLSVPFSCVGIYGKNSPDWLTAQYACASYRLITVPLYDTLGDEALSYICTQGEISVVICDNATRALKLLDFTEKSSSIKHIIVIDSNDELKILKAKACGTAEIHTFDEVVELGSANPVETKSSKPDDLVLICYTSGTTGVPKGVEIPNKMMLASLNNNLVNSGREIFTPDDIYLSYLPLAHVFEQMFIILAIYSRGKIGFYSGDPKHLMDDARALKPTVLTVVPRILSRIYEGVRNKLGKSTLKHWLLEKAIESKCNDIDRCRFTKNTIWDWLFFAKVRALFGGNVVSITCGGAPLPSHVLRFSRAAFSCWVFVGYGSTESAASVSTSFNSDVEGGHVGAPVPGLRVKLVDIESMEINAARDNKGEICIKGPSCSPGYYKEPELTAALIDEQGWMHTGDVGIWTENNSLRIVDRCKHIFKLCQGEYIAPEKVESVYMNSSLVSQVFVDGDTQQAYPVAIVVPDVTNLIHCLNHKDGQANGSQGNFTNSTVSPSGEPEQPCYLVQGKRMTLDILCKYEPAIKAVLEDLTEFGKRLGLKGFEQVRAIFLSSKEFTIENRMLTPTLKSAREIIRREFSTAIQELYRSRV